MRYLKVLLLVALFFLSMVFFFQNQTVLSTEMELHLNLFFVDPMKSIALPFYFLVLAAFVVGAVMAVLALVWDKMHLSAKHMKATWRVRSLEKEVDLLKAARERVEEERLALEQAVQELTPQEIDAVTTQEKSDETPKEETSKKEDSKEKEADKKKIEDIKAPDPDKQV